MEYGYTYKMDKDDDVQRIINFEAKSEEQADKKYNKWLQSYGFIKGESLGEKVIK